MNRQAISKACHDIGFANRVGEAQSLYLGAPRQILGAAGQFTLTGTAQRPLVLQTLNIEAGAGGVGSQGTISAINVAGQSCMTSNAVAGLQAFNSLSFGAHARSIGISVNNNMQVTVIGNVTAGANVSMAVGCDPIPESKVKTRSQQAESYNFVHGCGSVAVGAGATGTLTSVSQRAVTLGEVILELGSAGNIEDLYVTSFRIAGLEMLAGQTGADDIPLAAFQAGASQINDLTLGYCIRPQAQIDIDILNISAGPITVNGTIFCLPWSGDKAVLSARKG